MCVCVLCLGLKWAKGFGRYRALSIYTYMNTSTLCYIYSTLPHFIYTCLVCVCVCVYKLLQQLNLYLVVCVYRELLQKACILASGCKSLSNKLRADLNLEYNLQSIGCYRLFLSGFLYSLVIFRTYFLLDLLVYVRLTA